MSWIESDPASMNGEPDQIFRLSKTIFAKYLIDV